VRAALPVSHSSAALCWGGRGRGACYQHGEAAGNWLAGQGVLMMATNCPSPCNALHCTKPSFAPTAAGEHWVLLHCNTDKPCCVALMVLCALQCPVLCCGVLCRAVPCRAVPCRAMLCCAVLCRAVLCRWCVRCTCLSQACGCQSTPLSTETSSSTSASPLNAADKQQQQQEEQQQQQQQPPARPLAAADTPQQQQCQGSSSSLSALLVQLQGIPPKGLARCLRQGLAA